MGKKPNTILDLLKQIDPEGGLHACWNWTGGKHNDGYGVIRYKGKKCKAHRLFYKYYIENINDNLVVRHTCDNPACCNPLHLIHGTQADNVKDMWDRNRGVITPHSWKLSKEKINLIFELKNQNLNGVQIAKKVGCSFATVYRYLNSKVTV